MDWLNYHHLRYFWTVAKEGGLARAAEKLNVSQPSISGQIRELENALGEKLFRRVGRKNVLTDAGQIVFDYADEIFALGRELVSTLKQQPTTRALRFHVGIADSVPKFITNKILQPAFSLPQSVHAICREGKLNELLLQLVAHRLDLVLADELPSSGNNLRSHAHSLGDSGTTFCASGALASRLKRDFPKSLHDSPSLLPAENTSLRRALEVWFRDQQVRPRVVAECEDLALMNSMAADGRGFIALPTAALADSVKRYGFHIIGQTEACRVQFYAITAERRIHHPAVNVITACTDALSD